LLGVVDALGEVGVEPLADGQRCGVGRGRLDPDRVG
jgi:hypothetical protein